MNAYQKAVEKIKKSQCKQPICIMPIRTNGITGPTGPTGPAPSFSIGSVTTGAPGTQASVTITPNFNK